MKITISKSISVTDEHIRILRKYVKEGGRLSRAGAYDGYVHSNPSHDGLLTKKLVELDPSRNHAPEDGSGGPITYRITALGRRVVAKAKGRRLKLKSPSVR